MYEIMAGYKVGRAVLFYDLFNPMENVKLSKTTKDEVVKMCEAGEIMNTTIQWWENKPIVRMKSKNIPILKLDKDMNAVGQAETIHRKTPKETENVIKADRVVVSKPSYKRRGVLDGYDVKHLAEQCELRSNIKYDNVSNLAELAKVIQNEFSLCDADVDYAKLEKKFNMTKAISAFNRTELLAIQSCLALYMSTLAYEKINKTYIKYSAVS